ncbi:MAG: ATP-dependent DNA helicase, partial [cyanobacterium endosymbiont of Rhopalodia fuxianensis]
MTLLEAEVHASLRAFLRQQGLPLWDHHLTMARLVSRGLRLGRSAIIQTGSTVSRYGCSYLMPALLSDRPVLLVASSTLQRKLLTGIIPKLQEWLQTDQVIHTEDERLTWDNFRGILMVSPQTWLSAHLEKKSYFSLEIPTLIDNADELEDWTRKYFTSTLKPHHWQQLQKNYSAYGNLIQEVRFYLEKKILSRSTNPYQCYLLTQEEYKTLQYLGEVLTGDSSFKEFWKKMSAKSKLLWASIDHENQNFSLHISPLEVGSILKSIWQTSSVVLMGGFLDGDQTAITYRDSIGLKDDVLCLKFSPNRQNEFIKLYIRDRLPMPNTPEFQGVMLDQVRRLISLCCHRSQLIVILIDDMPLKVQVGTALAAEFGSRVQVEKTKITNNGILISGWDFWHNNYEELPIPQLLVMATLPIPSLENPLVAARVG